MAASSSGYNTIGLPILTDAQVQNNMLFPVDTEIGGGSVPQQAAVSLSQASAGAFGTVAAAGATQGNATAISPTLIQNILVTVTASTEGVVLPAAVTGRVRRIFVPGTVGVKVYPPVGARIDTSSTNVAITLAAGKGSIFIATDLTHWKTLLKGA